MNKTVGTEHLFVTVTGKYKRTGGETGWQNCPTFDYDGSDTVMSSKPEECRANKGLILELALWLGG